MQDVMIFDRIGAKSHEKYSKEINLTTKIEAYTQYNAIKKLVKVFTLDIRENNLKD